MIWLTNTNWCTFPIWLQGAGWMGSRSQGPFPTTKGNERFSFHSSSARNHFLLSSLQCLRMCYNSFEKTKRDQEDILRYINK